MAAVSKDSERLGEKSSKSFTIFGLVVGHPAKGHIGPLAENKLAMRVDFLKLEDVAKLLGMISRIEGRNDFGIWNGVYPFRRKSGGPSRAVYLEAIVMA